MSSPYDLTALSSPADENIAGEGTSEATQHVIKQEPRIQSDTSSPSDLSAVSTPPDDNQAVRSDSDAQTSLIKQDPGLQRVKAEPSDADLPWSALPTTETPRFDNEVTLDIATSASLEKLVTETTPEKLEAAVREGVRLLDQIQNVLEVKTEEVGEKGDSAHWLKQIDSIRTESKPSRTIVGVVGNTGAGKSSVIK